MVKGCGLLLQLGVKSSEGAEGAAGAQNSGGDRVRLLAVGSAIKECGGGSGGRAGGGIGRGGGDAGGLIVASKETVGDEGQRGAGGGLAIRSKAQCEGFIAIAQQRIRSRLSGGSEGCGRSRRRRCGGGALVVAGEGTIRLLKRRQQL